MSNTLLIDSMKSFFLTSSTLDCAFRIEQLRKLADAIARHETRLHNALYADLHKSPPDAYTSETGYIQREIRYTLKNIRRWSRPRRVSVPALLQPARAHVVPEPKGVVLIIGPWNYPVQLVLSPLVAAIAAGNCAIIKPSELTPNCSAALRELIEETFQPDYIRLMEGGRDVAEQLLKQPVDHIFFTGGTETGRAVAQAAARQLIPVTLELGGKNPVVIGTDCDLKVAARRIARGKWMNAGQLCVAPDHVWIPRNLQSDFIQQMNETLRDFYGSNPQQSPDYGRIINAQHIDRLVSLYPPVIHDKKDLYLAPTLILDPPRDSLLMRDEIFGPLLPILAYDTEQEIIDSYKNRPAPLALYLFIRNPSQRLRFMTAISSGGVCINDTVTQL
ncbi:MAG: aldehyde dehydrogenase family protein, partial [Kiritimatiellaceae bacterium]|nr:aldehyde dehydrogenase family protein [Kiritimatiellaceae bacterium]